MNSIIIGFESVVLNICHSHFIIFLTPAEAAAFLPSLEIDFFEGGHTEVLETRLPGLCLVYDLIWTSLPGRWSLRLLILPEVS